MYSWNGRGCCRCLYLIQLSTKWVASGEDRVAANISIQLVNLHGVQAGLSQAACPQSLRWDAGVGCWRTSHTFYFYFPPCLLRFSVGTTPSLVFHGAGVTLGCK